MIDYPCMVIDKFRTAAVTHFTALTYGSKEISRDRDALLFKLLDFSPVLIAPIGAFGFLIDDLPAIGFGQVIFDNALQPSFS